MSKRVTMKDIARDCQVSVMTVSRALNGKKGVKPDLQQKILKKAEALGYRPDPALTALVRHRQSGRTSLSSSGEIIPFLAPLRLKSIYEHNQGFFSEWMRGVSDRAKHLGYHIKLEWIPPGDPRLDQRLRTFYHRGIRGILLSASLELSGLSHEHWAPFSIVMMGSGAHRYPFHAVRNDYFQMGLCAVDALYQRGYRRIGYLKSRTDEHVQDRVWAALCNRQPELPGLHLKSFPKVEKWSLPPEELQSWINDFQPDLLMSIGFPWHAWGRSGLLSYPENIGFTRLNRSQDDDINQVSGVTSHLEYQGKLALQTLHQLILNNETGIPEIRTIFRVDGKWTEGSTTRSL